VELESGDGKKIKLPYDGLTPESQYGLERAKTGDDAKSQVGLAEWCVQKRLYEQARTHFRKALAADAGMSEEINAKVVVARKTASKELLARAKSLKETDPRESRRLLSILVQELPLEEAAAEARTMLADDTTKRKSETLSRQSKPSAKPAEGGREPPKRASGDDFSEATVKLFQPVINSYQKMLDATQEGLLKGDSAGIKEFEKALKEGDKIRKVAEGLRPQGQDDEEISEALALVDSKLQEALVDVRMNLVDSYLLRTSYSQAADVVKEGLAEYPQDERLRQAMNRVTAAAADGIGGDWVIVGGPR
jgi:hypothetical protein